MNTNDRATLRRWASFAHDKSAECYRRAFHYRNRAAKEHQAKRWARFAVACERKLKEIEG